MNFNSSLGNSLFYGHRVRSSRTCKCGLSRTQYNCPLLTRSLCSPGVGLSWQDIQGRQQRRSGKKRIPLCARPLFSSASSLPPSSLCQAKGERKSKSLSTNTGFPACWHLVYSPPYLLPPAAQQPAPVAGLVPLPSIFYSPGVLLSPRKVLGSNSFTARDLGLPLSLSLMSPCIVNCCSSWLILLWPIKTYGVCCFPFANCPDIISHDRKIIFMVGLLRPQKKKGQHHSANWWAYWFLLRLSILSCRGSHVSKQIASLLYTLSPELESPPLGLRWTQP